MGTTVYERRRPAASVIEHSLADTRQSVYWIDDLPEDAKRPRPDSRARTSPTSPSSAAAHGPLDRRARQAPRPRPPRDPRRGEAGRLGGIRPQRRLLRGLTHGRDNGLARWAGEIGELDRLGLANLDAIEASEAELGVEFEFERNGSLDVAVEPHQVEWLHEAAADAASRGDDSVRLLDEHQVRAEVDSPAYLGAVWNTRTSAILHPAKLAAELARVAEEAGVEIFERSPVRGLDRADSTGAVRLVTEHGRVDATRAVLATNVFPSLLKRNRLMTVPVYDYVLMTEPLSAEQRRAIGWTNRRGVGDMASQFHYSR